MSEAELTEQLLTISEMALLAVSVTFTILSAYIAGLYWFIRESSLLLRSIAFGIFTLTALPVIAIGYGLYRHHEGIGLALLDLQKTSNLSPLGLVSVEDVALNLGNGVSIGLSVVGLIIYLAMFYITFFHKWIMIQKAC